MRSVVAEDKRVGLLLFDEPSASLDPAAEHGKQGLGVMCDHNGKVTTDIAKWRLPKSDLFDQLRRLIGNKIMVFSTHRFGNLTRHADLIL